MVQTADHPQNSSEYLVYYTILATWLLWLVGGLYIAGPVLGCVLCLQALYFYYIGPVLPESKRLQMPRWPISVWLVAMTVMLVILIAGHLNFSLGTGATIKSSIGWAKGWLLIALFIFAGAVLPIRREIVYRAICRTGKYTIMLLPFFLVAPFAGLPATLWVSPLQIIGGSGPEYFATILYTLEPGSGAPRWQFFAPWSPAAGMVGLVYLICACQEQDRRWRNWGIAAALAMILLSQSRLALVGLVIIAPVPLLFSQATRPLLWFLILPIVLLSGWFALDILDALDMAKSEFSGARADSTRVRETLGRIAVERWQAEAFWFGHGVVERGPHLVEYMPIGSHHSWYGLLFVKGLLGLLALAVPLTITLALLLRSALLSRLGQTGFAMTLLLFMYSFGENLESLAYLYWPALLLIGMALQAATQRRTAS
ncbi:O-antigen ligase family protein [uncultured Parasphingorhabdus sp.]|uniref:O-antigen ligase family protein n=1 Tax=uncultured Parasphingorhabdus sp. TaxID=2709694 RepID=UPI002AA60F46|nr:O-antigen ligase family protein [uncultured Parasphingorhabdus sp.]